MRFLASLTLACLTLAATSFGEVRKLEEPVEELVLEGQLFGESGSYVKLSGTVVFAFDPKDPANAAVVDLDKAPIEEDGMVLAYADIVVLKPSDPEKGKKTALVEVCNRGKKASLSYFNRGTNSLNPVQAVDFGDGWLQRSGLTLVWIGWQHDVPLEKDRLRMRVPFARDVEDPIEGLVRCDWVVDTAETTLALGHRGHIAYPVADAEAPENVLSVRAGRLAPAQVIERSLWRFGRDASGEVLADSPHITLEAGFQPGQIYELTYKSKDPAVVGLGLAAVRDLMSYMKYDKNCPFPVEKGIALGISQTGRFLRHFLYQGFNTDSEGRTAFDGFLIHTAGAGRGSFNHRFAQPSRDAHRYSSFFYPTDLFPFSSRKQRDPIMRASAGLMDKTLAAEDPPKVFYTNTGYEYWGRAASLLHTSLDGSADVEPLDNERIYHLASAQHMPGSLPPDGERVGEVRGWRGNPLDFLVVERALLHALVQWVVDARPPPDNAYPRIDKGTLVPIEELEFPLIPGIEAPKVNHEAYRADYGPEWADGVITLQPPKLGPAFPSLVSQVDAFGNEIAGVPTVEILVPLATFTPWSVRVEVAGGHGELVDFYGNFIPLPSTEAEKNESGDSRPSLDATYSSKESYLERIEEVAAGLVSQRYLLEDDLEGVIERCVELWDWIESQRDQEEDR